MVYVYVMFYVLCLYSICVLCLCHNDVLCYVVCYMLDVMGNVMSCVMH